MAQFLSAIYTRKLLRRSSYWLNNIFFVDDNQENIEAAQKIGMKTHLFISNENLKNALTVYF